MSSLRRGERGSALLVAVILTLVFAIVGLALVKRTNAEMDAISAKRHHDRMVSCAEAGREMVMSQFRVFGIDPTTITLSANLGGMQLRGGHFDSINIAAVTPVAGAATGGSGTRDLANGMLAGGASGSIGPNHAFRITVVCTDTSTQHAQEIEYDLRWGI